MYLEDSEGNVLENETGEQEGSGSWSITGDRLEPSGDYLIVIECTNGEMEYEIVITMRPFKKSIKVISFIISTYHRKNEMAWNHCMNPL